jgi:hypothetical protein
MLRMNRIFINLICAIAFCCCLTVASGGGPFNELRTYNVVWNSPSEDYFGSMPLGNGDISLNVWIEQNGDLLFYIGKTDSWGDNSRLLKVGRVRLKLTPNPFEDSKDFQQILCLQDGTIYIQFGPKENPVKLNIWVDANNPVIHITADADKPITLTAFAEPWRTEKYELETIEVSDINLDRSKPDSKHAPTIVEPDVILKNQKGRIGWYHHNTKSIGPELTMRQQGLENYQMTDPILHRTFGAVITADNAKTLNNLTLTTSPADSQKVGVYVLTKHPSTPEQWLEAVESKIKSIDSIPFENRTAEHKKWWADFWNRSWIFAEQNSPSKQSMITTNKHPVRIGLDQTDKNKFTGSIARVSIFNKPLSQKKLGELYKLPKENQVKQRPNLLLTSNSELPNIIEDSSDWDFRNGLTIEAWLKCGKLPPGGGRIVDKITPGGDDGFLFDTYPGNSLRLITTAAQVNKANSLPADEWTHVAAVVNPSTGTHTIFINGEMVAQIQASIEPDAFVVTRAYILQRFINACAGRGAYPIKFNGSIFTVPNPGSPGDADYRRWGPGYWWQNTRLPYISMCTSGDFDLMQPLFNMYAGDVFELSKYRVKHYLGHEGVYFPECIFFWGTVFTDTYGWTPFEDRDDKLQTGGWHKWEWVSGPELVFMMLDYYEHTQDETFLSEKILPVANQVLLFFDNYYETSPDGKLIMHPSQAVETWWDCTNPMPEVAGLDAITRRILELPVNLTTKKQRTFYEAFLKKIPEIPTRTVDGVTMLAPAEKFDLKRNIENPELYAVFPFRLVSFERQNADLGHLALQNRWDKGNFGWRQDDIFMAYLGLAEEAKEYLVGRARNKNKESRFPAFWGPNYDWIPDQDHGGVLLKAFQSMIMQTDGKEIYLLPAWPDDWDVDFKLHAPYKTTIEGKVRKGKIEHLKVNPESREDDIIIQPEKKDERIKAFCVDFNWGSGGPNGFSAPGLYANASPVEHFNWYKDLGVNTIQTFCVSCCGYAWYKSDIAPVQPGMKTDFLKEITELAHKDGMKVMGYFCVGANTHWAQTHPDLSYGTPSAIHIPFTTKYLDYLCACIEDALTKTDIDGFMIDWLFSPPLLMNETKVRWLDCEKKMYEELFKEPFPGKDAVDERAELVFQQKALQRCWQRVRQTAKSARPDCIIWLSCFDLSHPQLENTTILKEVDWVMNETPVPEKLDAVIKKISPHAKTIQCIVGGSTQYDASLVINDTKYKNVGLYGFAPWPDEKTTLPPTNPQNPTMVNICNNIEKVRKVFTAE